MGYRVVSADSMEFIARDPHPGEEPRLMAPITDAAGLQQSRGRIWRYPPHSTGRRHRDHAQEEVFVVISGTLTMLLGDGPERVDVGTASVIAVDPMTALQVRNESDEELVCFIYGAPPLQDGSDMLDSVPLPPRAPASPSHPGS